MSPTRTAHAARRGFTLTELLVVVGIMAVLAGMTAVVTVPLMRGHSLRAAAGIVQQMIYRTRTYAIMQRTEATLGFYVSDRSMILYDGPDSVNRVRKPQFLPVGVQFMDDPPVTHAIRLPSDQLIFSSRGSINPASPDGMGGPGNWRIRITDEGGDTAKVIEVLYATGLAGIYDTGIYE